MRAPVRILLAVLPVLLLGPSVARASHRAGPEEPRYNRSSILSDSTRLDSDTFPIAQPADWQPGLWGYYLRECVFGPLEHALDIPDKLLFLGRALGAHTRREAVDVNAFDEVPNSTWFTNRNHMRAVPVTELVRGPDSTLMPAKPWIITHAKQGGQSTGFQIKDADGRKWLVKLDPRGYPQLSSGADMLARTLLHAAGYNVPHNESVRFRPADLHIDPKLLSGAKGGQFTQANLDTLLERGAILDDGSYSAIGSLFLSGHALGSPSSRRRRPGDANDWYSHANRRELRGLYVLASWLGFWDTKDANYLDTFVATGDRSGHVKHYLLDVGSSFGAQADGPKALWQGYERFVDVGWTTRRVMTLGFAVEPWRRAHQETGIPSVGNFESTVYQPGKFTEWDNPVFREMTDRDGYWGAKIVASFSDAQIEAAVDAARYEDPRAREYLVRNLIQRRDKIARHWFGRVAPLDYFDVQDQTLRFHDLAVDLGLTGARGYDVAVESRGGRTPGPRRVHLDRAEMTLPLPASGSSKLLLDIGTTGDRARTTHVELVRRDAAWILTGVTHG
jgi:hypothetical protein